ncbi:MAG: hypothetical protein CM1200mP12_18460 [Gammaproteobacteria bacterium]|nr:MAG: hypothetical protein CM1200mP12_18460 [Gammaproteobacteria bacterium]
MLNLGSFYPEQYNLAIKAPISATYHGLVPEVEAPLFFRNLRRYMINE